MLLPICISLVVVLLLAIVASVNYCLIMPGSSYKGKLPPLSPEEVSVKQELHQHVHQLAVVIGERNYKHPDKLEKAARYINAAIFRYPFYHTSQDTIDKIDFDRLTRVTTGIGDVIASLAITKNNAIGTTPKHQATH